MIKYDLIGDIDCRTTRDIRLFGDTTIWFVFNDKGNVHSDDRGSLFYNNNLEIPSVKRIYAIENINTSFTRGWQGHKVLSI